jgi:hypothetical protein
VKYPYQEVLARLDEEAKALLARVHEALDAEGLDPALRGVTWDELDACMLVYSELNTKKKRLAHRRREERRIRALHKVEMLYPDSLVAETCRKWREPVELLLEIEQQLERQPDGQSALDAPLFPRIGGLSPGEYVRSSKGLSAFEMLAGRMLPAIYEEHCKKRAAPSRNQYIRFAHVVLCEMGIKTEGDLYTFQSISDALRKARELAG